MPATIKISRKGAKAQRVGIKSAIIPFWRLGVRFIPSTIEMIGYFLSSRAGLSIAKVGYDPTGLACEVSGGWDRVFKFQNWPVTRNESDAGYDQDLTQRREGTKGWN